MVESKSIKNIFKYIHNILLLCPKLKADKYLQVAECFKQPGTNKLDEDALRCLSLALSKLHFAGCEIYFVYKGLLKKEIMIKKILNYQVLSKKK